MSERRSQVDDFARLTEETERLARHVEDLRLRIAASAAKRRASSGTLPAQSVGSGEVPLNPTSERPPHGSPSERPLGASAEPPHDATTERPHGATTERPHGATTERPHPRHSPVPERSAVTERPHPRHSPLPERTSCLASVSRWLPPLRSGRDAMESGVHEKVSEAGRYCIVSPRKKKSSPLPSKPPPPKADVA